MDYLIIKDIIVPIISALISGGLTLIGVLISIKYERKRRKEEIRIKNKPLFLLVDTIQDYKQNYIYYEFENKNIKSSSFIEIILRNTDNAILILDHIEVDSDIFFPSNGTIVDKNMTFSIFVHADKSIIPPESKISLFVKDSIGNPYQYIVGYSSNDIKYPDILEEI